MLSIHFKIELSCIVPTMQQEPQQELTEMSHLHLHKTNTLKSHHSARGEVGLGKWGVGAGTGDAEAAARRTVGCTQVIAPGLVPVPLAIILPLPEPSSAGSADGGGKSHCSTTDLEVYYVTLAPDSEA